MEDSIKCERSRNIRVNCDINFVDNISLIIVTNELRQIKYPSNIIRDLIKELEKCKNES